MWHVCETQVQTCEKIMYVCRTLFPLVSVSIFPVSVFCLLVYAPFGEKCQINRNVTSRIRGLLLYLLIEVPSYLSVWQLLLTNDVFFESESAFFGSECYRQQRSVRVKLNAGLYTELLLPPAITKLVIHLIVNPDFFFQRIHSLHEITVPTKGPKQANQTWSSEAQVV